MKEAEKAKIEQMEAELAKARQEVEMNKANSLEAAVANLEKVQSLW